MPMSRKKIICWKCDKEFAVEIDTIRETEVRVIMRDVTTVQPKVGHKYLIQCPHCDAENEVRL